MKLAEFATSQPQASNAAFTFGLNIAGHTFLEHCLILKTYVNQ